MKTKEEKKGVKRKSKMVKKQEKKSKNKEVIELLKILLIIELGKTGMTQHEIRKIVGTDIKKVNRIVKHLRKE